MSTYYCEIACEGGHEDVRPVIRSTGHNLSGVDAARLEIHLARLESEAIGRALALGWEYGRDPLYAMDALWKCPRCCKEGKRDE